jgi:hypothetical protein
MLLFFTQLAHNARRVTGESEHGDETLGIGRRTLQPFEQGVGEGAVTKGGEFE